MRAYLIIRYAFLRHTPHVCQRRDAEERRATTPTLEVRAISARVLSAQNTKTPTSGRPDAASSHLRAVATVPSTHKLGADAVSLAFRSPGESHGAAVEARVFADAARTSADRFTNTGRDRSNTNAFTASGTGGALEPSSDA